MRCRPPPVLPFVPPQGINQVISEGPTTILRLLGTYVPTSSNFFINYIMFRAFVAVPLRMLWPHIGVRMYLLRRYCRCSRVMTDRERAFLVAPVSPRYGFEVRAALCALGACPPKPNLTTEGCACRWPAAAAAAAVADAV